MKVLAIGNSFSQDATRYLHQIAESQNVELEVVNLCMGGCPLEWHYDNMVGDKRNYMLEYNGKFTGFYVTMKEALESREWDVITLQQVSHYSPKTETYYPYVTEIVKYIRSMQPKARLLIHETWAYEDGSKRLVDELKYASSQAMLSDIRSAYSIIAESEGFDGIIPSGTLFGIMLDSGIEKVHRDTFHADFGLGRYALGLLWFSYITGEDISANQYRKLDVIADENDIKVAIDCVKKVMMIR